MISILPHHFFETELHIHYYSSFLHYGSLQKMSNDLLFLYNVNRQTNLIQKETLLIEICFIYSTLNL